MREVLPSELVHKVTGIHGPRFTSSHFGQFLEVLELEGTLPVLSLWLMNEVNASRGAECFTKPLSKLLEMLFCSSFVDKFETVTTF